MIIMVALMHKKFAFIAPKLAVGLLTIAAPFAACKEAQLQQANVKPFHPNWDLVCMGRLEVSLPSSAELAASNIGFDKPSGFNGIENVQASFGVPEYCSLVFNYGLQRANSWRRRGGV